MKKNDNHFIVSILDDKNKLLDFERFSLKTEKASYNAFVSFIKSYGLSNYARGFNVGGSPEKIVISFQSFEPYEEKVISEKSYIDFIKDIEKV